MLGPVELPLAAGLELEWVEEARRQYTARYTEALHLLAAKGGGGNELLSRVSLDLDFDKAFASERQPGEKVSVPVEGSGAIELE